jgi:hypothetical protein
VTKAVLYKLKLGTRVYYHKPGRRDHGDEGKICEAHTLATGLIEGPRFIQWDDGNQTSDRAMALRYVRKLD